MSRIVEITRAISDGTGDNATGSAVNATIVSVQIIATGLDAAPTIKLQESNDRTNFLDISGASVTLATPTDNQVLKVTDFAMAFLNINTDVGAATTGSIDFKIVYK